MENKQIAIIAIIIAAVVLVGGIWWYSSMNPANPQPAQTGENNTEIANEEEQGNNVDNVVDTTTGAKLSYTNAVKLYKDRRIQIDNTCQVSPANASFKAGTAIMLDNRANTSKTIKLDGVAYTMGAYDFKIITLSTTAALPHTISIDCGTGSNNAQIILQK